MAGANQFTLRQLMFVLIPIAVGIALVSQSLVPHDGDTLGSWILGGAVLGCVLGALGKHPILGFVLGSTFQLFSYFCLFGIHMGIC